MSKENLRDFIEKFYNDEEFTRQVLIEADAPAKIRVGQHVDEEQQYRDFADVATRMGYATTPEEFKEVNKAYLEEIGPMESIRRIFTLIAVATDLVKQTPVPAYG